jgi:hypothetical protein
MYRCKKCGRTSATVRLHEKCSFCDFDRVAPHERRYCSHCSKLMIETLVGAEKNMMFYGDQSTIPLASPYDKKTGERNYCYRYQCIDHKEIWWGLFYSDHDSYFVDTVVKVALSSIKSLTTK